jgi:hypothetical protein
MIRSDDRAKGCSAVTDSVYEPGQDDLEDDGVLEPSESLVDRGLADVLDEGYVPPDGWSPGEGFGTTLAEERQGESLEQRLAQEVPDLSDDDPYEYSGEVGDLRAGRLVAPDEGAHEDIDAQLLAYDVGIDGAGASAEEAAVHVIPE